MKKGDAMTTETQKTVYLARRPFVSNPLPQRIVELLAIAAAFGFVIFMLAGGHVS